MYYSEDIDSLEGDDWECQCLDHFVDQIDLRITSDLMTFFCSAHAQVPSRKVEFSSHLASASVRETGGMLLKMEYLAILHEAKIKRPSYECRCSTFRKD